MASGHLGQICPRNGVQRLQDRIYSKTSNDVKGVVDGDSQEPVPKGGSRARSPVHAGQTSHTRDSGVSRDARVLLPDLPSSQGIGWLEADSQPQGFQQICGALILSDGDTANSHGLPRGGGSTKTEHLRTVEGLKSVRNMGDLYCFKRRLLSRGRSARAYQVPPLRLQRQSLRVSGALFGLSMAPRVFTRIVRVIEAFLKVHGVDMHQYLDDWLMKNQSKSLVKRHRDLTLFWVNKLGFLVNEGKSQLTPTQAPAFLGSTLDLHNMLVFLMLHDQWTQVSDSPYVCIYPNEATLVELEWWTSQANLRVGRHFLHPDPTMSIVTDASKEGWGGHLGDWVVSGHWSRAWAKRHINWLKLQAVWLTLKHFLPQLQGTAVDVISDNSTTVAYINKVGGTQSPSLCCLALDVWAWCRQHDIYLVASHLSGDKNVLTDALSRGSHRHPTEWTLHNADGHSCSRHQRGRNHLGGHCGCTV